MSDASLEGGRIMKQKRLPVWVEPAFWACAAYGVCMLVVAMFTGQWATR